MAVRLQNHRRNGRKRGGNNALLPAIILAVAGIVIALIVRGPAATTHSSAVSNASTAIVAEYETVSVPVPADFVPAGTKISDIRFKHVQYPKKQLPKDAVLNIEKYANGRTVAALPANIPILSRNISFEVAASNPVVESIPEGMRAITVKVDATSAVEGWAGSGSIVDVLLVQKDKTTVIAEKVKILSAERSVSPVDGTSSPNVPKTVTLLVTQEQCLAINTAIPLGRIAFALRGYTDDQGWKQRSFTSAELSKTERRRAKKTIKGYFSIKDGDSYKSFALAEDNKWLPTNVAPSKLFRLKDKEGSGNEKSK